MGTLILEADMNVNRPINMEEFILLPHSRHPWYAEQITFMLMNTDNTYFLHFGSAGSTSHLVY